MKNFVFITFEGSTFQPDSDSIEPDIENMQVIGFAKGISSEFAFEVLLKENSDLINTNFNEILCYELKDLNSVSFSLKQEFK